MSIIIEKIEHINSVAWRLLRWHFSQEVPGSIPGDATRIRWSQKRLPRTGCIVGTGGGPN